MGQRRTSFPRDWGRPGWSSRLSTGVGGLARSPLENGSRSVCKDHTHTPHWLDVPQDSPEGERYACAPLPPYLEDSGCLVENDDSQRPLRDVCFHLLKLYSDRYLLCPPPPGALGRDPEPWAFPAGSPIRSPLSPHTHPNPEVPQPRVGFCMCELLAVGQRKQHWGGGVSFFPPLFSLPCSSCSPAVKNCYVFF